MYEVYDRGWKKLLFRYQVRLYGFTVTYFATLRSAKRYIQDRNETEKLVYKES